MAYTAAAEDQAIPAREEAPVGDHHPPPPPPPSYMLGNYGQQYQLPYQPPSQSFSYPVQGQTGKQLDPYYEQLSLASDQLQQLQLQDNSLPQLRHWSEVMYECGDIQLEEWSIAGGSDYGQQHYFINSGDILLEIDGHRVAGLTRADVLNIVSKASSHAIKAVSSSSSFGLPIDLKEYLGRRFARGSLDHDLQATIRDNVYSRTVPCTTRPPRSSEVDGVDYKFVSRAEFAEMERSGVLLESGIYAGHFYGTPLPLADPVVSVQTSPQLKTLTNAHSEEKQLSALALKRRRNRSNIAAIDASSLPHGWERISDAHYGVYYIDHINKRTQYERPYELELAKGQSGFGFTLVEVESGLVVVKSVLPGGSAYTSGVIQPSDVLVSVSGVSVAGMQHSDIAKLFSTFSPGDKVKLTFARGYALPPEVINGNISEEVKSFELISLSILKGTNGFGFTISDGGPSGQKVKKILDTKRCGPLCQGDVLASVNGVDLTGFSHVQVVEVLKHHCAVGETCSFVVKRLKDSGLQKPDRQCSKTPVGEATESVGTHASFSSRSPSTELLRKQIVSEWQGETQFDKSVKTELDQAQASNYVSFGNNGTNFYGNTQSEFGQTDSQSLPTQRSPENVTQLYNNRETVSYENYEQVAFINTNPADMSLISTVGEQGDSITVENGENEYEYFRVCLQRGEAGFGFRIVGGAEENRPVTIGSIVIGGVAHLDGILRAGDELISIHDQNVMNASHHHVVELMAQCGQSVQLLVRRKKHCDAFDVQLSRDPNKGFGFVIISCGQCALIGRIIEQSPAARCQRLKIRDKIIAVNGVDITQMSHPEIVNMIKESGLSLRLRIVPADCYTVELIRGPKGFGFSVRGGAEFNGMPLFILRVAPDGPAWSLLNVGDEIIEINGMCTVDVTHAQAVLWISESGPQVKLKLRRRELLSPLGANAEQAQLLVNRAPMSSLASHTSISTLTGQQVNNGIAYSPEGQPLNGLAYPVNGAYSAY